MTQIPEEAIEKAIAEDENHRWLTLPDEGSLCDCGEPLADGNEYTGANFLRHAIAQHLTAAYPAIEKQVRAEVAAEIREAICGLIKISLEIRPGLYERDLRYEGLKDAYAHAARIAEG